MKTDESLKLGHPDGRPQKDIGTVARQNEESTWEENSCIENEAEINTSIERITELAGNCALGVEAEGIRRRFHDKQPRLKLNDAAWSWQQTLADAYNSLTVRQEVVGYQSWLTGA